MDTEQIGRREEDYIQVEVREENKNKVYKGNGYYRHDSNINDKNE